MVQVGGHLPEPEFNARVIGFARLVRRAWRSLARSFGGYVGQHALRVDPVVRGEFNRLWTAEVELSLINPLRGEFIAAGDRVRSTLGLTSRSSEFDLVDDYVAEARGRLIGTSTDTWQRVRDVLREAHRDGLDVRTVAAQVVDVAGVSPNRALVIARTELHAATEAGAFSQARLVAPSGRKTWLATSDERTRPTHVAASYQTVPLDRPFIVGGGKLRFPGDPRGPAAEVINCRCTTLYDLDVPVDRLVRRDRVLAAVAALLEPVTAAVGGVNDVVRKWKPHLHPRGKGGRFIEKGAVQVLLSKSKLLLDDVQAAVDQLTPAQWDKLTSQQQTYIWDQVQKVPDSNFKSVLSVKLQTLGFNPKPDDDDDDVDGDEVGVLTQVSTSTVPSPLPAHKGKKPGEPFKPTTTLIWGKYENGTVIAESSDGEIRVVWNANLKRYVIQSRTDTGTWLDEEFMTKKDLYDFIKTGGVDWAVPFSPTSTTVSEPKEAQGDVPTAPTELDVAAKLTESDPWDVSTDPDVPDWASEPVPSLDPNVGDSQAIGTSTSGKLTDEEWDQIILNVGDQPNGAVLAEVKTVTPSGTGQWLKVVHNDSLGGAEVEASTTGSVWITIGQLDYGMSGAEFADALDELAGGDVAWAKPEVDQSIGDASSQKSIEPGGWQSVVDAPNIPPGSVLAEAEVKLPDGTTQLYRLTSTSAVDTVKLFVLDENDDMWTEVADVSTAGTGEKFSAELAKLTNGNLAWTAVAPGGQPQLLAAPVEYEATDTFSWFDWPNVPMTVENGKFIAVSEDGTYAVRVSDGGDNLELWYGDKIIESIAADSGPDELDDLFTGTALATWLSGDSVGGQQALAQSNIPKNLLNTAATATAAPVQPVQPVESDVTPDSPPLVKLTELTRDAIFALPGKSELTAVVPLPDGELVTYIISISDIGPYKLAHIRVKTPAALSGSTAVDTLHSSISEPEFKAVIAGLVGIDHSIVGIPKSVAVQVKTFFDDRDTKWHTKSAKIWETVLAAQARPEFAHLSVRQLLALLDGQLKKTGDPFQTKMRKWLETNAGTNTAYQTVGPKTLKNIQVSLADPEAASLPFIPKSGGGPAIKSHVDHVGPGGSGTFIGEASELVAGNGDISGVSESTRKAIYTAFKGFPGTFLSGDDNVVFSAVGQVATQFGLSRLQALRVIDAEGAAASPGGTNKNLFEKKIKKWLGTPVGAATALGKPIPMPPTPALKPSVADAATIPSFEESDKLLYDMIPPAAAQKMWSEALTSGPGGTWTTAERKALTSYTGGIYHVVNKHLYHGTPISDEGQTVITNAQLGMRPLPRSLLLHRGVQFSGIGGASSHDDVAKLVGSTWKSGGFFSTSVGNKAGFSNYPVQLEIEVPAGTPGAYIASISNYKSENELLLAAGLHYHIVSVKNVNGKSIVRVRVVPEP